MALEWSYVTLIKKSLRIAEELTFLKGVIRSENKKPSKLSAA